MGKVVEICRHFFAFSPLVFGQLAQMMRVKSKSIKLGPTLEKSSASDANFLIHPLRRSRKKTTRADSNRELEEDSLAEEEEDGEDAQVVDIAGDMTLVSVINNRWDKFPYERLCEFLHYNAGLAQPLREKFVQWISQKIVEMNS